MKNIQFAFIIFLHGLSSHAQNPHNGIYIGIPNKNVKIKSLIEYYDKGYYMETTHNTSSGSNVNSWNVKTDVNFQVLWNNFIIYNPGNTTMNTVVTDPSGNRYVAGKFNISAATSSPLIVKYNACGEQVWCRTLPLQGYDQGIIFDMLINDDEEIIVLTMYLPNTPNQATSDLIFLSALSQEGDLLWRQAYASPSKYPLLRHPSGFSMTYHNEEYYISGYCYYAYPNNPGHFYLTPFFVGIDSQFQEKWILPFGMEDAIRGRAFDVVSLSNNMLMGIVDHWLPGIEKRTTLAFFDTDGNVTGYNAILNESLSPEYTWNVTTTAQTMDDSVLVSPIYFGPPSQQFWGEIIYDTSGNVHNFNVTGQHDLEYKMVKTTDENFVVGVTVKNNSIYSSIYLYKFDENLQSVPFDTTTYVYDSLCPYPIQSGTIDLTGCMVLTSTDWIPTPQEYYARIRSIPINIYPNPAKDHITFALENTEHYRNITLRCFNLLGMEQYQTKILRGQQQASANVSNWQPGMYIAVVYSDGKPVGRGKFVVQR